MKYYLFNYNNPKNAKAMFNASPPGIKPFIPSNNNNNDATLMNNFLEAVD